MPNGEDDTLDWVHPGLGRFEFADRAGTDLIADETGRKREEGDPRFQCEGLFIVHPVCSDNQDTGRISISEYGYIPKVHKPEKTLHFLLRYPRDFNWRGVGFPFRDP